MTEELAVQPASDAVPETNVEEAKADPSPAPEPKESSAIEKMQKRIDQLTYRLRESERQQVKPEPQTPASETLKPPTKADYDYDDDKYQAAMLEYVDKVAEKKARDVLKAEREQETQRQKQSSFKERQEAFMKTKPDYAEKVIEGGNAGLWACTAEMAQVIAESELGPEVAYYLAENEEKAAAIAQLSPYLQAREIGRIEAQLEASKTPPPAPPKISKAPPPPPKIEASDPVVEKDPKDMTDAEFRKWRLKSKGKIRFYTN